MYVIIEKLFFLKHNIFFWHLYLKKSKYVLSSEPTPHDNLCFGSSYKCGGIIAGLERSGRIASTRVEQRLQWQRIRNSRHRKFRTIIDETRRLRCLRLSRSMGLDVVFRRFINRRLPTQRRCAAAAFTSRCSDMRSFHIVIWIVFDRGVRYDQWD